MFASVYQQQLTVFTQSRLLSLLPIVNLPHIGHVFSSAWKAMEKFWLFTNLILRLWLIIVYEISPTTHSVGILVML